MKWEWPEIFLPCHGLIEWLLGKNKMSTRCCSAVRWHVLDDRMTSIRDTVFFYYLAMLPFRISLMLLSLWLLFDRFAFMFDPWKSVIGIPKCVFVFLLIIHFNFFLHSLYLIMNFCLSAIDNEKWKQIQFNSGTFLHWLI